MQMSFIEKSTWISLLTTLFIFTFYFFQLTGLPEAPPEEAKRLASGLLFKAIAVLIILEILFHAVLAASNRKAAEMGADERDKLIMLKANNLGYTVLAVGVVLVLGRILLLERYPNLTQSSTLAIPMLTAHLLMFSFILSEVVRFASQIFLYRKEA